MLLSHLWGSFRRLAVVWFCVVGIFSTALSAPVQLDPEFAVGSGPNNTVQALAEESGGTLWIGGLFSTLNGSAKYGVAKLDAAGNVDPAFAPPSTTSGVTCIVPLGEGKILIGCQSIGTGATYRQGIARLNADGSVDTSFDAGATINGTVQTLRMMPDGKILVGGWFTKGIAKLEANGSPDPAFTPGTGIDSNVRAILPLPSGKIMVGGSFSSFNGVSRANLCRLNADGGLDVTFGSTGSGPSSVVYDIASDANGRLLVAGDFTTFNSASRSYVARLTEDGSTDPYFLPNISAVVHALVPLADGRILIGGDFTTINGAASQRIAVLHADGKTDTAFGSTVGASASVRAVKQLGDGKILLGGTFATVAGGASKNYAKILAPSPAVRAAIGSISPRAAEAGTLVRMLGSNFSKLGSLEFAGNVPAMFTRISETEISVTVPQGALSGFPSLIGVSGNAVSGVPFAALPVPPGTLDPAFDVGSGTNATVRALARDAAGRILLAGSFSSVDGLDKRSIARLNLDGRVDTTFYPRTSSSTLYAIAVQPDGKILVGGSSIARIHPDGSIDASFNASAFASTEVYAVALQADGKILIAGIFTRRLARLHPDGSLDLSFDVGTGFSSTVKVIRIQPDGKILIGGSFDTYNGLTAKNIARLTASGGLDPTFQVSGTGISGSVEALALQEDGGIVIGGSFYSINGKDAFRNLARLRANGALDESFNPAVTSTVNCAEIAADGRIAIGGAFTSVGGSSRNYAALLHADGSLETNFNTTGGPSSTISTVLPGDGGNLTIGGAFLNIGGQPPRYFARLAGDAGKTRPAAASLSPSRSVVGEKLMVFGSNLGNLTSAEFSGGVAATIFPISQTRVELEIPVGAMSGPVTLRNAFGETTSLAIFKLLAAPLPVITGIPSESVAIGSQLVVSGKNFYDVTSVRIGVITASFVVNSATHMTVTVPTNALTARVILSGPGGTAESASDLLVTKAPPAFTSAASSSGVVGQNFSFTLKATNNPTGFTASLPAGLVLNPATGLISGIPITAGLTTVSIFATNEGGTTGGSLAITISPPLPPVVTSVSPDQIPAGGRILVSGTYLFQTSSVTVGGVAAVFEVLSDSRIAVVMPAGVESGVVRVITLQGNISSTGSVTRWDFQAGSQIVSGFGENSSGQTTPPVGLDDAVAIAAGQNHSLALRADGRVSGWGGNEAGQASPPTGIFPAIAIAAGAYHSLALQADGSVASWGRNDEGQCSGASGLSNIAAIAAGGFHSLALTRMGTVTAWGSDSLGQARVPENLGGVVAIAAGGNFSIALKSDGSVVAWGDNSSGQTEIPITATGIVAITAGSDHVVALKADGTLIGWGANWAGQINLPTATASPITQISAGSHHTHALRADGSCVAWGANWLGQSNEPVTTQAVSIAAGGDHSLILSATSPIPRISTSLIATGKPGLAFSFTSITENGPSTFTAQGLPPGLAVNSQTGRISAIPTRGGDFLVTLTARNGYGISRRHIRLFIGPYILGWGTSVPGPIPQVPEVPSDVAQVAAGTTHGLALHRNGTVTGWGSNSYGERTIPTDLTNVIAIAAGDSFSLALKSDGTVHAWGRNPIYSMPFVNPIATGVVAIDSSGSNSTVLMANGTAKVLFDGSPSYAFGSELISVAGSPDSYSFSPGDVAINRSGYVSTWYGLSLSSSTGFDRIAQSGEGMFYSRTGGPIWGIQRGGKLHEFLGETNFEGRIQTLRPETSSAVDVVAGDMFALVLNADATATTLTASRHPNDSYSSIPAAPRPTSDNLVNVSAIAARNGYALAIKESSARARFTSLRVTEGRVGQSFNHQLITSGGSPQFSAALLPTGLTLNSSTGVISGSPSTAGIFNFVAIASYSSYFISQVVSVKFTSGVGPVDIALTGASLAEALPASSPVGSLAALDYSPTDTFTYALVAGPGSTDNSKFKISGNQLLTNAILDFESKPLLSVRIQVTDSGRNTFAKVFQITVTNVPTDDDDQDGLTETEELQLGTSPLIRDTDQDGASDGLEIAMRSSPLSATSKPARYVAAWGSNTNGQCNVPLDLGPVIAVAAGSYHTLALKEDGSVAAWGQNSSGQCDVPPGLSGVVSVAAGYSHSVALKADGSVIAWGSSPYATVPADLSDVIEISAKEYLTAALQGNGQVVVWGSSSNEATTVPAAAAGSVHVAAGSGSVLALNRSGMTVGWGSNSLGVISGPANQNDLTALALSYGISLGLTQDARVQIWGSSSFGALDEPAGLDSVIGISAGYYFSLATRADGRLFAWGYNSYQQTAVPAGLGPVQMAAAGTQHVVALVGSSPPEQFLTASVPAVVGLPVSRQLAYSGTADRFNAWFLPPGLSLDTQSGSITGVPQQKGSFKIRVTAEKGFSRITKIISIDCENPRRFEEWCAVHFPGTSVAPHVDSDGDGLSDFLEYALHRDPAGHDPDPPTTLTTVQANGGKFPALRYERYKDAIDIRYLVQRSSDLIHWTATTATVSINDHGETEIVTVRDTLPMSATQPSFMRLKVDTITPPP